MKYTQRMVKPDAGRVIEDIVARLIKLASLLRYICKAMCGQAMSLARDCVYGSVRYSNGDVDVTLYPEIAWENRDKP